MGNLRPPGPRETDRGRHSPTFAIVITAYEAAEVIAGAVASALAQTRPAEEVLVVDDGSTDDLPGALAPYRERIRLVRKENGGGASARNAGIGATTPTTATTRGAWRPPPSSSSSAPSST
jgi:cellulose synthase/poly-beta-1,6-N-acetylglucosamine synthase-like glycosyltransferase